MKDQDTLELVRNCLRAVIRKRDNCGLPRTNTCVRVKARKPSPSTNPDGIGKLFPSFRSIRTHNYPDGAGVHVRHFTQR